MIFARSLRDAFTYKKGRQGTGYEVKTIIGFGVDSRWGFDSYLIRFKEEDYIPPHIDEVQGMKHFRLNILLIKAKEGGEFKCDKYHSILNRVYLFRPDKYEHSVTKIKRGKRLILSFGLALKD